MLLTGATGLIGAYLLARLFNRQDLKITAVVRGRDNAHAKTRLEAIAHYFGEDVSFENVEVLAGDLTAENLGLTDETVSELRESVTDLFHSAAEISFDEDENSTISRTNLQGTRHVLELCGPQTRVFYVSTAYVAGNTVTDFCEDTLDIGQSFKNAYEQSKFEAEGYVRDFCSERDLSLTVLRPSIVIGEYATGRTFQFVAFYKVLKTIFILSKGAKGAEMDLPCNPNGTLNFIPVDLLTNMIEEIVTEENCWGKTYHLINSNPPTDGELIKMLGELAGIKITPLEHGEEPKSRQAKMFVRQMNRYMPYLMGQPIFGIANRDSLKSSPGDINFDIEFVKRLLGFAEATNWGKDIDHRRA